MRGRKGQRGSGASAVHKRIEFHLAAATTQLCFDALQGYFAGQDCVCVQCVFVCVCVLVMDQKQRCAVLELELPNFTPLC